VPTPQTVPRTEQLPPFLPPWIVKPRFGAGSVGVRVHNSHPHPLSRKAGRGEQEKVREDVEIEGEVIQPLIVGRAASVAFLIGPKQTIALAPCWQHLDEGFQYLGGSTPIPSDLAVRAVSIARRAIDAVSGLNGYVGVDVILGDEDMAIETNPRLTTSYIGLRQLAQDNLAEALLRIVRGDEVRLRWRHGPISFQVES
jgi:predicted ATP-grasp superfamily ATP-dependent carboligase